MGEYWEVCPGKRHLVLDLNPTIDVIYSEVTSVGCCELVSTPRFYNKNNQVSHIVFHHYALKEMTMCSLTIRSCYQGHSMGHS